MPRSLPAWTAAVGLIVGTLAAPAGTSARQPTAPPRDTTPTLGLDQGRLRIQAGGLTLELVRASQTVAALRPVADGAFDFTPGSRLERRAADGFVHLGDLTLRFRQSGDAGWRTVSTSVARKPVTPLPSEAPVLATADLSPTLPADLPLRVRRAWEERDGRLVLRFTLENTSSAPVEIGGLGIPLVFDNILTDRSLDEAHAAASFSDPYIGNDAGWLQVTRLNGHGPALVVVPHGDTPLEAYGPLLDEPTRRGITFEGFHEWVAHSRAWAENEWKDAEPWNPPTSSVLEPGASRSWGLAFLLAPAIREIEATVLGAGRPVAVGVPGYVLPMDVAGRLFLKHRAGVADMRVEPEGALSLRAAEATPGGWSAWDVRGRAWGRARLTVTYEDGLEQTIHYKVIKPTAAVAADLGRFLTNEQWFERPGDPFGRSPSVITYDYEERRQVTEDNRVWVAGLGDEGGSAWLTAVMKQLVRPDPGELAKLQRFVDGVVWGGLQVAEGDSTFAVRKSLLYWEPDSMPPGTYSPDVPYGGWSSWNRAAAMSVGRSYDYPHVTALHWVMYRLAHNHEGLVTNHPWAWYLERAYGTARAMVRHAPHYAQFGQMEGTVFVLLLQDLQREGWAEQARALEADMRARADVWRELAYPYGSEMPWDSTGQEEVYAWCRWFGFDEKAAVTLNAILGYMPTVPHWGYNGSARRYWDFLYAGRLRRVERQLHHYGSGLNAIPVLAEYRDHPDDLYLLRVGYGGVLGSIANVTQDGFGPGGFHAFPSTLRIDGISGDYAQNFFGHAVNTGAYLVRDPMLGWLAFGGDVVRDGARTGIVPKDAARARVYLAPLGLWITLDAGTFEDVWMDGNAVEVTFSPRTPHTSRALLRVERPAKVEGTSAWAPAARLDEERGAWVVPLGDGPTRVVLRPAEPEADGTQPNRRHP